MVYTGCGGGGKPGFLPKIMGKGEDAGILDR